MGIFEHVGHVLTFMILTDDTQKIIHCSVVRSASDTKSRNLRAEAPPEHEPKQHIKSYIDDPIDGEDAPIATMPIIHPEELVGHTLNITQDDGQSFHICIVEAIKDH